MLACGMQNEASLFPEAAVIYYKCRVSVYVSPHKTQRNWGGKKQLYCSMEN